MSSGREAGMLRVAVAVVAGLLLSAPVHAQDVEEREEFRAMFEGLMRERLEELEEEGVSVQPVSGDLWIDYLSPPAGEGEQREETFHFSGGAEGQYLVMALCDGDCSDIDLHLWRADDDPDVDEPLLSDTEEDREPLLLSGLFDDELEDGEYKVQIQMYDCQAAYCYFAVGIYGLQEQEE